MSPAQAVAEGLHISGTGGNSTHTGGEFRHARHCFLHMMILSALGRPWEGWKGSK